MWAINHDDKISLSARNTSVDHFRMRFSPSESASYSSFLHKTDKMFLNINSFVTVALQYNVIICFDKLLF